MTRLLDNARLEQRVLELVDTVRSGGKVEDSRVELKAIWPKPEDTFRQLAGHANAARGENILWVIGVDEKQRSVPGAAGEELANWWPQVQKHFESQTPDLIRNLSIAADGVRVQALLFDTARAPYTVRPMRMPDCEVPWRDGTRTRSARRHELLSLLTEEAGRLEIELREGIVVWREGSLHANVQLYIAGAPDSIHTFPEHRCVWSIRQADSTPWNLGEVFLDVRPRLSDNALKASAYSIGEQLFVEGSGYVGISIDSRQVIARPAAEAPIQVEISLGQAHSATPVTMSFHGHAVGNFPERMVWHLANSSGPPVTI